MYYLKMQTLIQPNVKLKTASFDNSTFKLKEKFKKSKLGLDFKFYQKVLPVLIASCAFLIFPESPKSSEVLCKKYYSTKACLIW